MRNLPDDPALVAAAVLSDLALPTQVETPEEAFESFRQRMAAAGVTIDDDGHSEQGYLLRSLTSRALILETAWLQTIRHLSDSRSFLHQGQIVRAASRLQDDLDKTLALIVRIRRAQGEDYAPFLTAADQSLADDRLAERSMMGKYALSIPQVVQAEALGEEVYEAEFMEKE